jgi:hypothetical protein
MKNSIFFHCSGQRRSQWSNGGGQRSKSTKWSKVKVSGQWLRSRANVALTSLGLTWHVHEGEETRVSARGGA